MNRTAAIIVLAGMGMCVSAAALTGSGDSPVGGLDTVAPQFTGLGVDPPAASAGQTVTITFTASETLLIDPTVRVNGNDALFVREVKAGAYTYEYTVEPADPLGLAAIDIAGRDVVGNPASGGSSTALEIVEAAPPVPLRAWPLGVALVMVAGGLLWARARRRSTSGAFLLLLFIAFAASAAVAQAPTVSNVAFVQGPDGGSGTQVDITYDLDAPNGPCDITVSLSKDGGVDGFSHPVTTVTGDLTGVTTGTDYTITWDIATDYPDEDIPNAALRVTADDGLVAPSVDTFTINGGAASTTDPAVVLDNVCSNAPTEYMASEASDFSGATWETYATAPSFTLSSGEGGTKTVYFKVRNAAGESAPVSDTIELTVGPAEQTILLPGDVPLELVWIPSGSFQMGRYPGEAESNTNEDPQHPVTLTYGFWMGKYEVTQEQWLAVRGSWPGTAPSSSYGLGDSYPAYYISWYETKDFITSLNTHIVSSGQGPLTVRLPSEAEWEYASRAGTQTRFYFGDSLGCAGDCSDCAAGVLPGNRTDYMWYCGNNSPNGSKPVGGKLPNGFGLYDMSGNVYEWCEDDYHGSYTGAPADGSAWIDSPRASGRLFRGGCWLYYAWCCRSAYRLNGTPGNRYYRIGFRLAAVP